MGYVKVVKNKNYYKRFTVKFRRRRQNKTNYRLRRRLIVQDKRKFNTPKWRLVVRITNRDVIVQVASAKMIGDQILCAAYAHELKRYGLKVGLTNYSACYATGLLIARRLLTQLKLNKMYPGKKRLDGKFFMSRASNLKLTAGDCLFRPFKCILDTGLHRCTTGARVFAVLKGAIDGGLNIPYSQTRFYGFKKDKKARKGKSVAAESASIFRDRIFGETVAEYMRKLQEENPEKFSRQFSDYIKEGLGPDDLEDLYARVHRAIRKDPTPSPKKKRDFKSMDVRRLEEKHAPRVKLAALTKKIALRREQIAAKKAAKKGGASAVAVDADGDVSMS